MNILSIIRLDYLTATTALDRLRTLKGVDLPVALVNWPNAQPYCFGWDGRNGYDYVPMELHLRSLLKENPNLKFILSFGSLHGTPYYWSSDHHDQLAVYESGYPMQQAFREFLTGKYGTDAALQNAWKTTSVSLNTAGIPTRIEMRSPLPQVRDCFECYNRLNAELCIAWSEALKQGAPEKLVWVTHGQIFGWPAENRSPQGSGHNAPGLLIQSPAIDGFISAAVQDRDQRNPLPRHATASLRLHGKQAVHELNLMGLRAIGTEDQCAEITLGIGYAAVHGCSVAVGEPRAGRGAMKDDQEQFNPLPYDSDTVRSHLARLLDWQSAQKPGRSVAEVTVFHSPTACYLRAMEKRFNEERIERFRNETLCRIGLPFDEYLLSDFAAVSGKYKAWIFLDAADMTSMDWKTVEDNPGRSFFACSGEAVTDPAVLRHFAENNSVTVWTDSNNTVFASDRVCVFAARSAGEKKLRLPEGNWKNALTGEPAANVFKAFEKQVTLFERDI